MSQSIEKLTETLTGKSQPQEGYCYLITEHKACKTLEESKETHFGKREIKEAKQHSLEFLNVMVGDKVPTDQPYALIVEGGQIMEGLRALWKNASVRICTDNSIEGVQQKCAESAMQQFYPDLIIGDLDKVNQSVVGHFKSKGVETANDKDENTSDIEKCLLYLKNIKKFSFKKVVLYDGAGKHWNNHLSLINEMFKYNQVFEHVVMVNDNNVGMVLSPGHHDIIISEKLGMINGTAGIYPLKEPVQQIFSSGLHWNVDGQRLCMGEFVSASM